MGIHIAIEKVRENARAADYQFRFEERAGMLRLDKRSGAVLLIDVEPDDAMAFRCAARKLLDHWRVGEVPDRTDWAA